MSVVVGEGPQAVELFLAGCVPEGELDVDVVDEYVWGGGVSIGKGLGRESRVPWT